MLLKQVVVHDLQLEVLFLRRFLLFLLVRGCLIRWILIIHCLVCLPLNALH